MLSITSLYHDSYKNDFSSIVPQTKSLERKKLICPPSILLSDFSLDMLYKWR